MTEELSEIGAAALGRMRLTHKDRDLLIEEYRPYVEQVTGYLIRTRNLPRRLFEDLLSAGYLGLVEAASRFDARASGAFKTFAFLRIRGAIIDSIRRYGQISGRHYHGIKALRAAQDLREELFNEEQQRGAHATVDKRARLAALLDFAAQCSMAFRVELADIEAEASQGEKRIRTPEEADIGAAQGKLLRNCVKELPFLERLVIEEYYFKDKSFSKICAEHGELSKSWICKLHKRALKKLREAYEIASEA